MIQILNFVQTMIYFIKFSPIKNLKAEIQKNEIIGFFRSGGMSENISFISRLFIESKIRIINKQNLISVLIIFFKGLLSSVVYKLLENSKYFINFKKKKGFDREF